jgi:hypothetical protein
MKSTIFWDVTLCRPVEVHRRFGGRATIRVCLSCFLLGLFFDLEDGGNTFLRIVSGIYRSTRRYISEDTILQIVK